MGLDGAPARGSCGWGQAPGLWLEVKVLPGPGFWGLGCRGGRAAACSGRDESVRGRPGTQWARGFPPGPEVVFVGGTQGHSPCDGGPQLSVEKPLELLGPRSGLWRGVPVGGPTPWGGRCRPTGPSPSGTAGPWGSPAPASPSPAETPGRRPPLELCRPHPARGCPKGPVRAFSGLLRDCTRAHGVPLTWPPRVLIPKPLGAADRVSLACRPRA